MRTEFGMWVSGMLLRDRGHDPEELVKRHGGIVVDTREDRAWIPAHVLIGLGIEKVWEAPGSATRKIVVMDDDL